MTKDIAFLAALRKSGYFAAQTDDPQPIRDAAGSILGLSEDTAVAHFINGLVDSGLVTFRYTVTPEEIRENHREAFTRWQLALTVKGRIRLWVNQVLQS